MRMGKSVNKLTNRASAETKGRPGMIPRALALSKRAAIRGFIGLSAKGGAPSIVDEAPLFHANQMCIRDRLSGTLKIVLGDRVERVKRDESFYFRPTAPHKLVNAGKAPCRVLWVSTPPSF